MYTYAYYLDSAIPGKRKTRARVKWKQYRLLFRTCDRGEAEWKIAHYFRCGNVLFHTVASPRADRNSNNMYIYILLKFHNSSKTQNSRSREMKNGDQGLRNSIAWEAEMLK